MGFPDHDQLFKHFFLILALILWLLHPAIAQNDPQEKDALYALKTLFNHPFLNQNWSGPPCFMGFPAAWFGIQCFEGRVTGISLQGLGLTGRIDGNAFLAFTMLKNISLRDNSLSGSTMNFYSMQALQHIDFSGNKFKGEISRSLLTLDSLESLQLQDNNLSGHVPEFSQPTLKVFNVSNNKLQGPIPLTRTLLAFGSNSYSNNPGLCGPPTLISCNSSIKEITNDTVDSNGNPSTVQCSTKSSSKSTFLTMFLLVDIVGLVAVILLFILYFRKAKKLKEKFKTRDKERGKDQEETEEEEETDELSGVERRPSMKSKSGVEEHVPVLGRDEKGKLTFMEEEEEWFQLNDLLRASAEGLGKGIFGNSYKARMEGRPSVVVKRLRDLKPLSVEEFTRQLYIIADQKHPNLLPLLAYYYSKDEKLMVYKYADKGNLFNRIHGGRGNKDRIPFRWNARLSVARGVARALEYLYLNTKSQSTLPHGNLKSTNVLIDENETVLVSDYGLGSLIALPIAAQRMVSYKSPDYQTAKRLFRKTDVWSYGCLLLELLTGRPSIHSAPPGINGVDLCSWVHRAVREEWTAEIFDVEISVQRRAAPGMLKLLQIAMRCCDKSPDKRPEMSDVVREVENIKTVAESEDEDDLSMDRSLTDESLSNSISGTITDEIR